MVSADTVKTRSQNDQQFGAQTHIRWIGQWLLGSREIYNSFARFLKFNCSLKVQLIRPSLNKCRCIYIKMFARVYVKLSNKYCKCYVNCNCYNNVTMNCKKQIYATVIWFQNIRLTGSLLCSKQWQATFNLCISWQIVCFLFYIQKLW